MSSHKNFCALTVSMIVGAGCCVPTYVLKACCIGVLLYARMRVHINNTSVRDKKVA